MDTCEGRGGAVVRMGSRDERKTAGFCMVRDVVG